MSALLKFESVMSLTSCAECAVEFCIPQAFEMRLRAGHGTFYCPRGHQLFFGGKSDAERKADVLEAQLANERRRTEWAQADAKTARAKEVAAKAQLTKFKKRVSAGVCPCCNRTFQDLARHMATKHKAEVGQ